MGLRGFIRHICNKISLSSVETLSIIPSNLDNKTIKESFNVNFMSSFLHALS